MKKIDRDYLDNTCVVRIKHENVWWEIQQDPAEESIFHIYKDGEKIKIPSPPFEFESAQEAALFLLMNIGVYFGGEDTTLEKYMYLRSWIPLERSGG